MPFLTETYKYKKKIQTKAKYTPRTFIHKSRPFTALRLRPKNQHLATLMATFPSTKPTMVFTGAFLKAFTVAENPQADKYIYTYTYSLCFSFNFPIHDYRIRIQMAVQEVNKSLLSELEDMGFPEARATKALMCSGNSSIEAAVNWIIDHENDTEIDEIPSVPVEIDIEASNPPQVSEQVKLKAQELRSSQLRDRARRKKEEEEKKLEREREKERIRAGKELLKAKRMAEETERKRYIAQRKAEKEEERRAREKIRQKLQQDKLERSGGLGLQKEGPTSREPGTSLVQERGKSLSHESSALPVNSASVSELMRECLRNLNRRNKDDASEVKRAFQTLLIYVRNVVNNPDEPKFRKIRLSNQAFQDRVGRFKEGIQFLELCGFEKVGEFLVLPRDKVDMALLKSAGAIIHSASTNPFFGLLSRDDANED